MEYKNARWLALVLLAVVPSHAQTPKSTGALNGRVFAISGGGGLLPARMANGWVLSCNEIKAPDEIFQDACTFFQASLNHRKQVCGAALACTSSAALHSLEDTLEWTKQHHIKAVEFTTDEEGFFKLDRPPVGRMMIFAYGQSGSEQCVWIQSGITFKGASLTVKLSSPFSASR